MAYFNNVMIPVFGLEATATGWVPPVDPESPGVYFSDASWMQSSNAIRIKGVTDGIAKSVDYNTVMRQCSFMSSLFANVLAYRNSVERTLQSGSILFGGSTSALIGTDVTFSPPTTTEAAVKSHISALSNIFGKDGFLFDGEVTNRTIAEGAVTSDKLRSSVDDDGKRSVGEDHIKNESIGVSKLGAGLISKSSDTANGITVTLLQKDVAGDRGFIVGVTSSKVGAAEKADLATSANNLKTSQADVADTFYLCGTPLAGSGAAQAYVNRSGIYAKGSTVYAQDFDVTSDATLKENFEPVGKNQVRALVEGVKVQTFNFKGTPDKSCVGVTAQDILAQGTVLGELLVTKHAETGTYTIGESKLVYVLWDYVQQQNARIEALESKVEELMRK